MDDIWPMILRNLSINDLFNCRLVNKKFKQFSDRTNGINKLIIGEPDLNDDHYWIYNNKIIEDKEMISLQCFRSIKSLSIFNLDKYLKHLKINDKEFELEDLKNLMSLESLEFSDNYRQSQQIMNFNNLKVFVSNVLSFELNTPKLEKIKLDIFMGVKLNNLDSIKHLITFHYCNELESFKNLEIMELLNMSTSLNRNLLIIFKHLKKLRIRLNAYRLEYSDRMIKDGLIKILNDKIKFKREIDIYLEGIKIKNIYKFNELKAYKNIDWSFRLKNYNLLDSNLPFIKNLKYEELERCVNNMKSDLATSFFDKFQNINNVNVKSPNDVDGLNWFLNNLKYLSCLSINCMKSDQLFYNNLPNTIRYLTISNKEDINYNFILKLSKLVTFDTRIDKDLFDLAFTSFLNLKYLRSFQFNHKNNVISIQKRDKGFILNKLEEEKLDYNRLLEKCNLIRSK